MESSWLTQHMEGILWFIEILWVGGAMAIFVVYFYVKRKIKQKKQAQNGAQSP